MLKQTVRAAFKATKQMLYTAGIASAFAATGGSAAAVEELPEPPFSYGEANHFFKKTFLEQNQRRPHLAWGALQGVNLAKALGLSKVSLVEFGVAGGNGLTALEEIAQKLEETFGVEIQIHGFDAATGMPKPADNRDTPNLWRPGFYPLDVAKLEQRLKKTTLHVGMVCETLQAFVASNPAPVAFIEFDLCYYSSTKEAFRLIEANENILLPRIHCFFRNTLGNSYGSYNGERLAISEFCANHETRKISQIFGLQHFLRGVGRWVDQYYMAHIFDHKLYDAYDGLIRESHLDLQG
jgi:hypothetical protein